MERRLTITVDHLHCVGNGMCLATAPAVFAHNEERQSVVVGPAGAPEEVVLRAAASCPTGAIRVEDAATGKVVFP